MTRFEIAAARIAREGSRRWVTLLAFGGVLVGLGVAMPWLTLFRGLAPVSGLVGEGGPLAGIALASIGASLVAERVGGRRFLRPLAAGLAAFVAVDAVLIAVRIAAYVGDPGPAGPLTQPVAGPGPAVTVVGATLLVVAVSLTPAHAREPLSASRRGWLLVAGLLLVAGWVHLLLVPQHLEEAPILGVGFLAAGIAQLVLAALAAFRPSPLVAFAVIGVNVALVVVYAYAVTHGLPFPEGHHEIGLAAGHEAVDLAGLVTKAAELVSIGLAFLLLDRPMPQPGPARL